MSTVPVGLDPHSTIQWIGQERYVATLANGNNPLCQTITDYNLFSPSIDYKIVTSEVLTCPSCSCCTKCQALKDEGDKKLDALNERLYFLEELVQNMSRDNAHMREIVLMDMNTLKNEVGRLNEHYPPDEEHFIN
jgi:hypothetical protein